MTKTTAALAALMTAAAVLTAGTPATAAVTSYGATSALRSCGTSKVPAVTGLREAAAKQRLARYHYRNVRVGVQKASTRLTVVTQLPAAGTRYRTCDQVQLILGE